MSLEHQLIKLFGDPKARRFRSLVDEDVLSRQARVCLSGIDARPDLEITDWKDFLIWVATIHNPTMSSDEKQLLKGFVKGVYECTPDIETVRALTYRGIADELIGYASEVAEGKEKDFGKVMEVLQKHTEFERKFTAGDESYPDGDVAAILEGVSQRCAYKFPLPSLNKALGGTGPGNLIVVASLPDGGKTSFVAWTAAYLLRQMPVDRCLLWLNNEEADEAVRARQITAATGLTIPEIKADPEAAANLVKDVVTDPARLKVRNISNLYLQDVEALVDTYRPGVLVIDQLSKILVKGNVSDTNRLGKLAASARAWSQVYQCPVIITNWARAEAQDDLWIPQTMLYNSRIGIPGEADVILTLGRDPEQEHNVRGLHVAKSKMQAESGYRDLKQLITMDPDRCQFTECGGGDEVPL